MNKYIENIAEIVKMSYPDGADTPQYDWSVLLDMYDTAHANEVEIARKEFYEYVKDRRFDKEGNEIV